MNKKTIMYIVGGVAVIGIGYYLWNKNKKSTEEKPSIDYKNTKDYSLDNNCQLYLYEVTIKKLFKHKYL